MLEQRAFEPEFLGKLDGLLLGARRARTTRAGRRNLGRVQGPGIEPENFREYTEGDDLRFLDWNAFARLDDLTMRTFRADRQVEATVMIDASASMGVPARDDKLGLALLLGVGLAYIAMSENDPVRLVAIGGKNRGSRLDGTRFYRRHESFFELRPFVSSLKCGGQTRLAAAAAELLNQRRPPGIVIVISDFLVTASDYEPALTQLVAAHHEVKVVHVMGESEMAGNYPPGAYRIRDAESGETREVTLGPAAAATCQRRATDHAERLGRFCTRHGLNHMQAFSAARVDETILHDFPRLGVIV
jgi:uncharacterized protein (DUF58 family)